MPEHEPLAEGCEVLALARSSPTQRPLRCPKQARPHVPTHSLASVASEAFANCSGQKHTFPCFHSSLHFKITCRVFILCFFVCAGKRSRNRPAFFFPSGRSPSLCFVFVCRPTSGVNDTPINRSAYIHPSVTLGLSAVGVFIQTGKKPGRDGSFHPNVFSC